MSLPASTGAAGSEMGSACGGAASAIVVTEDVPVGLEAGTDGAIGMEETAGSEAATGLAAATGSFASGGGVAMGVSDFTAGGVTVCGVFCSGFAAIATSFSRSAIAGLGADFFGVFTAAADLEGVLAVFLVEALAESCG